MKARKAALIIIIVAAAALRLWGAIACETDPDYSDMETYNRLALEEGIRISPPPAYPLFLRAIYSIAGARNYTAVFVIQALISTLTVWLVFLVARAVSGTATALVAAGIAAVYPNFIMYVMTTLTETTALLATMLMLAAVVLIRPERRSSAAAALLLFAGAVIRPAFLYFWPGVLAVTRRRLVFLAVTASVVVPLTVAGLVTGRGTNRGALAFYKTYNSMSNGYRYFRMEETGVGSRDEPSAVYLREALSFISENRWKTLDIIYVKTARIFSRGWDSFVMRELTGDNSLLNNILVYAYLPVMALGFIGMIRFRDERNRMVALPSLSYLVFFILLAIFKIRYRLLAEPGLIIFASITIGHICGFPEYRDSSEELSAT